MHPNIENYARGAYCLFIELKEAKKIKIGRLGELYFPAGCYVYVGSALNGLKARVSRHFRRKKKLRWHVDYFLQEARPTDALAIKTDRKLECRLCESVARMRGAKSFARGFGASDCSCYSHLLRFEKTSTRALKKAVFRAASKKFSGVNHSYKPWEIK